MYIASIILTHKNASKDILDCTSMIDKEKHTFYKILLNKSDISEVLILQTCNRFEVYISGKNMDQGINQALESLTEQFGEKILKFLEIKRYTQVIEHLFRVVSSIESLIIGENQIQSQIKITHKFSLEHNYIGQVLDLIFRKAIVVGKEIRTKTNISKGKVSISSAAVDLVKNYCELEDKNILIIGTGKMASLIAEYLSEIRYSCLTSLGRTESRIKDFSEKYSTIPAHVSNLRNEIKKADIIFSATSCPRTLITKEDVETVLNGHIYSKIFVDIASPADIDYKVGEIDNISYFSISDLKNIADSNTIKRENEICKVQKILNEEIDLFSKKLQHLHIEVFVKKLNDYTENIRKKELNKVLGLLGELDPEIENILEKFSKSLKKKLLHNFNIEARSKKTDSENIENLVKAFIGGENVSKN